MTFELFYDDTQNTSGGAQTQSVLIKPSITYTGNYNFVIWLVSIKADTAGLVVTINIDDGSNVRTISRTTSATTEKIILPFNSQDAVGVQRLILPKGYSLKLNYVNVPDTEHVYTVALLEIIPIHEDKVR